MRGACIMSDGSARFSYARGAIGAAGGVAGVIVTRAAVFYWQIDRLAFGLSLLIGVGLTIGIVELFARVRAAEHVARELANLPRPASLEAVDACSPTLRAVLRARLQGVRTPLASATFTSYLLGLLIMIGLLGTFLGLFEALRGAREALTSSSDVESLRSGLAAPMSGLTRAFGTSAAGVASSAMLGLAAVFARRVEAWLANAVNAYADGPLAPLTLGERQLAMLTALAQQGGEASRAAVAAGGAVRETAQTLRAELSASVAGVAEATERALRPALDRAVERASAVAVESLSAWS